MAEILDRLSEIIQQVIEAMGYPGIALIMMIENLFPPIPSEVVMPFAGFLVADESTMSFPGIVIAGTLGSVVGAIIIYYIGVWADEPIARAFVRRYGRYFMLSESDIDRSLDFFERYGEIIVFVGRLIPIIRSLISLPAGMKRMPMPRFLLFTTLGAAIWTTVLSYAGVVLGENWEDVLEIVDRYQTVTLIVLVLSVIAFVVIRLRQRLTQSSEPESPPDPVN